MKRIPLIRLIIIAISIPSTIIFVLYYNGQLKSLKNEPLTSVESICQNIVWHSSDWKRIQTPDSLIFSVIDLYKITIENKTCNVKIRCDNAVSVSLFNLKDTLLLNLDDSYEVYKAINLNILAPIQEKEYAKQKSIADSIKVIHDKEYNLKGEKFKFCK